MDRRRSRTSPVLRAGAAVAVLAGGLVAYGGDEEPGAASPSASTSSSPASISSPTDPPPVELPAAAGERTDAGSRAFVAYWFRSFNRSVERLDPSDIRALSKPTCGTCVDYAQAITGLREQRGFIETEGWRPTRIATIFGVDEQTSPSISVYVSVPAERHQESAGADIIESRPSVYRFLARPSWTGDRWVMARLDRIRDGV